MCGISGVELLVIIVAAIIILGPDKLPELMQMAGRLARDLRRLRGDLGKVTRELRAQVKVDDLQKSLGVDRVRERIRDAESEIDAIRSRIEKGAKEATSTADTAAGAGASAGQGSADEPAATTSRASAEPNAGAPSVRPAQGSRARGTSAEEAERATAEPEADTEPAPAPEAPTTKPAAPTGPPPRIRANERGVPEIVIPPPPASGGQEESS